MVSGVMFTFQSALRFAVVSDLDIEIQTLEEELKFQSALRFAVVSDHGAVLRGISPEEVSIRFEVRGGFRHLYLCLGILLMFQSALRFAVVSDWAFSLRRSRC